MSTPFHQFLAGNFRAFPLPQPNQVKPGGVTLKIQSNSNQFKAIQSDSNQKLSPTGKCPAVARLSRRNISARFWCERPVRLGPLPLWLVPVPELPFLGRLKTATRPSHYFSRILTNSHERCANSHRFSQILTDSHRFSLILTNSHFMTRIDYLHSDSRTLHAKTSN